MHPCLVESNAIIHIPLHLYEKAIEQCRARRSSHTAAPCVNQQLLKLHSGGPGRQLAVKSNTNHDTVIPLTVISPANRLKNHFRGFIPSFALSSFASWISIESVFLSLFLSFLVFFFFFLDLTHHKIKPDKSKSIFSKNQS